MSAGGTDQRPVLFCDADGNLFPSEGPAFLASSEVANSMLAAVGSSRRYKPEELRRATLGRNFRDTARGLLRAEQRELTPAELEEWVEREKLAVTERLMNDLEPRPEVNCALELLRRQFRLAVVTSSAESRLAASLSATGLDRYFPAEVRFSAEDSLSEPRSKPDPAVYRLALSRLGVAVDRALAIEDSPPGVQAASAAGLAVVGNTVFACTEEREHRRAELIELGAFAVVDSWSRAQQLACAWSTSR
jgi:HAD superfamily hydrolase (TIGR01509 family)